MFACDEGHSALAARLLSLGANIEDYTHEVAIANNYYYQIIVWFYVFLVWVIGSHNCY